MKIRQEDYFGLKFQDASYGSYIKDELRKLHMDGKLNPVLIGADSLYLQQRLDIFNDLMSERDNKNYFLTTTAMDIAKNVKVGSNFNYNLLNTISDQKSTYIPDKNRLFRFIIKDESLFVMYIEMNNDTNRVDYNSFKVDIANNIVYNRDEKSFVVLEELIKYLIFVELSDVEVKFLPPNKKVGTKKDGFKNSTKLPFTIINGNWNKIVIRTEKFGVAGHLRLQPYGKNNSLRKLIWISDYQKKGFIKGINRNEKIRI